MKHSLKLSVVPIIWIWILIVVLLFAAVSYGPTNMFYLISLFMTTLFVLAFQANMRVWRKLLALYWNGLLTLLILMQVICYTYQSRFVSQLWKRFHLPLEVRKFIGLEEINQNNFVPLLMLPTCLTIAIVIQLEVYNEYILFITSYFRPTDRQWRRYKKRLTLFPSLYDSYFFIKLNTILQFYLPHLIAVFIFTVGCGQVAVVHAVFIVLSLLAVMLRRNLAIVLDYMMSLWTGFLLCTKILYKTHFFNDSLWNVTCPVNEQEIELNTAQWVGYNKSENTMLYVKYIIILQLLSLYKCSSMIKRNMPDKENHLVFPNFDVVFPLITHKQMYLDVTRFVQYQVNYLFYNLGYEICLIWLVVIIINRIDFAAAIYSILLIVFLLAPKILIRNTWNLLTYLLCAFLAAQYFLISSPMPNICSHFFLTNKITRQRFYRWMYLPLTYYEITARKLIYEYILLLAMRYQCKVFNVQRRSNSDQFAAGPKPTIQQLQDVNYKNPLHDFISEKRSVLDTLLHATFYYYLWLVCLFILLAATAEINLFSMGYMVIGFLYLWRGTDLFTMSLRKITFGWAIVLLYNVIVMLLKVLLQIPTCIFPQYIVGQYCTGLQLLGTVCLQDIKDTENGNGFYIPGTDRNSGSPEQCTIKNQIMIVWDGICFTSIILFKAFLVSNYFQRVSEDVKAAVLMESRGQRLYEEKYKLKYFTLQKSEQEDLEKLKINLTHLKETYSVKYENYETHYDAVLTGNFNMFPGVMRHIKRFVQALVPKKKDDAYCDDKNYKEKLLAAFVSSTFNDVLLNKENVDYSDAVTNFSDKLAIGSVKKVVETQKDERMKTIKREVVQKKIVKKKPGAKRAEKSGFIKAPGVATRSIPARKTLGTSKDEANDQTELKKRSVKAKEAKRKLFEGRIKSGQGESGNPKDDPTEADKTKGKAVGKHDEAEISKAEVDDSAESEMLKEESHQQETVEEKTPTVIEQFFKNLVDLKEQMHYTAVYVLVLFISLFNSQSRDYRSVSSQFAGEIKILKKIVNLRLPMKQLRQTNVIQKVNSVAASSKEAAGHKTFLATEYSPDKPVLLQLAIAVYYYLMANTTFFSFLVILWCCVEKSNLLFFPLTIFVFCCGALIIPTPPKLYWISVIVYVEIILIIQSIFQLQIWTWNKAEFDKEPFHITKIIGIQREEKTAVSDIILLVVLCFHRETLKTSGIWEIPKNVHNQVDTNESDHDDEETGRKTFARGREAAKHTSLLSRLFARIRRTFRGIITPKGVGADYYIYNLTLDLLTVFTYLIWYSYMTGANTDQMELLQFMEERQFPINFFFLFSFQCILIIVGRVIYLYKSITGTFILYIYSAVAYHLIIFIYLPSQTGSPPNTLPLTSSWYLIKCASILLLAKQFRLGYPLLSISELFHNHHSVFHLILYKIYIIIPFISEVSTLLDWAVTQTTLTANEWFEMEQILSVVYITKCYRVLEKDLNHPPGRKVPVMLKFVYGLTSLLILLLLLCSPLLFFSVGGAVREPNIPTKARLEIHLDGYTSLFKSISTDIQKLEERELEQMDQLYENSVVASSFLEDYKDEDTLMLALTTISYSQWILHTDDLENLVQILLNEGNQLTISAVLFFIKYDAENQKSPYSHTKIWHRIPVNRQTRIEFLSVLLLVNSTVTLPNLIPKFIKSNDKRGLNAEELMSTTDDPPEQNYVDVKLTAANYYSSDNAIMIKWIMELKQNGPLNFLNQLQPKAGYKSNTIVYIFSNRIFSRGFISHFGEVGLVSLYTSYVFFVWAILRSAIVGLSAEIVKYEMPHVDRILQLGYDIYLVRVKKEFELEEVLFAKLIFLYKLPELMISWTRDPNVF